MKLKYFYSNLPKNPNGVTNYDIRYMSISTFDAAADFSLSTTARTSTVSGGTIPLIVDDVVQGQAAIDKSVTEFLNVVAQRQEVGLLTLPTINSIKVSLSLGGNQLTFEIDVTIPEGQAIAFNATNIVVSNPDGQYSYDIAQERDPDAGILINITQGVVVV